MFSPNPRFAAEVAREAEMRRFLEDVAREAEREVDTGLPNALRVRGVKVESEVVSGVDGLAGEVRVTGGLWHLPEYGGGDWPMRPYFRPAVLKVLASRGGRLSER